MGENQEGGVIHESVMAKLGAIMSGSSGWDEAPDVAKRAFARIAVEKDEGLELLRRDWHRFNAGWQARKTAEMARAYGATDDEIAMHQTPHRQLVRERGAAPHWMRCEHRNAEGARCVLAEHNAAIKEHAYGKAD